VSVNLDIIQVSDMEFLQILAVILLIALICLVGYLLTDWETRQMKKEFGEV